MSTPGDVARDRPPQEHQVALSPTWAKDMTRKFRHVLSTKRMNALTQQTTQISPFISQTGATRGTSHRSPRPSSQHQTSAVEPYTPASATEHSASALRNIPLIPTPPTDRTSLRFRSLLHSLSNTPCGWENPGLLDDALRVIPLEKIYDEAQVESDLYDTEAAALPAGTKPAWGYQDCVVIALMKWFRSDFFKWVNNPECSACHAPTIATGMAAPTPDEQARSAHRVELYQCSNAQCGAYERFPRYSDAFVLLNTRRGRVGEWANCFGMLCRAVGSRVRWIWNSEDHVWTEVYSAHRKRWVHVDVCEAAWDQPLLYTQGMFISWLS